MRVLKTVEVAQCGDDKWFISDYDLPERRVDGNRDLGWWVASPMFDTREEAEAWARKHYGRDVAITGPENWPNPFEDKRKRQRPRLTVIEGGRAERATQ
jgi:hypothetical protein